MGVGPTLVVVVKNNMPIKEVIEAMTSDRIEWGKRYMWLILTNLVEDP